MRAKCSVMVFLAASVLIVMPSFSFGQSTIDRRDAGITRQDNITSSGATVPLPGASKSAGQTSLDTEIERHNDHIDRSICSNC